MELKWSKTPERENIRSQGPAKISINSSRIASCCLRTRLRVPLCLVCVYLVCGFTYRTDVCGLQTSEVEG